MSLPSDWNIGKFLEWYTELPFADRPRKSPTFVIQNIETYFSFSRTLLSNGYCNYYLYLQPKVEGRKLEPFSFVIYSDTYKSGSFAISVAKFSNSKSHVYSFGFTGTEFSNRGPITSSGNFIKFCFLFKSEDGPVLPLEPRIDEKSTQADLMLSLQTDVEYLSLDFAELLKSGDFSDVQLLCNGGNIPAHKAILVARSKAFREMFLNNTEESKSGLINLATTEKSVMELCMEFIYKGKVLNMPVEKASNLYVLGHVLKIPSLTKMCADLMVSSVCEDNYIPYLVFADKYDDDYFKCGLIDYIYEHTELLKSESWMKFSDQHMKTAIDVYRKCMFK